MRRAVSIAYSARIVFFAICQPDALQEFDGIKSLQTLGEPYFFGKTSRPVVYSFSVRDGYASVCSEGWRPHDLAYGFRR